MRLEILVKEEVEQDEADMTAAGDAHCHHPRVYVPVRPCFSSLAFPD